MRKCRNCICRTCIKSCKCSGCKGKIKECKRYSGFRQLSIFDILNEPQEEEQEYKAAPRYPLSYYGLTDEDVAEFEKLIRSGGKYASLASQAAHRANESIAEYILLSVTKNKSYDELQKKWELREIERMPCGRSDFYGWRREFYGKFNEMVKETEK